MRTIIFILLFLPIIALAQKQDVYIKLTDANGMQIKGDAVLKGFERSMQALTINSGGKNNTQFSFTMNVTGASADLKRAMNSGEFLASGLVTVLQTGIARPVTTYTIKMEKIKVISCNESMGCNNLMTTTVILQATRIGWTYYQTNAMGVQTVSNKYGFDAEAGGPWTNF
jgi:type VI protein secretion system component Hcp